MQKSVGPQSRHPANRAATPSNIPLSCKLLPENQLNLQVIKGDLKKNSFQRLTFKPQNSQPCTDYKFCLSIEVLIILFDFVLKFSDIEIIFSDCVKFNFVSDCVSPDPNSPAQSLTGRVAICLDRKMQNVV